MIKKKLNYFKNLFKIYSLDGYIIPKNDCYFTEQVKNDRLRLITNFSGSAGIAVVLKNKNYLFIDSRYTIQAKMESGNLFKTVEIHKKLPKNKFKNIKLGFDPKLFTYNQLKYLFGDKIILKPIEKNLVDQVFKIKKTISKPFFSLPSSAVEPITQKEDSNFIKIY